MILLSIFFLIPIGIPIFSLVYIGFIGSYGLLVLLLYYKGNVPGTEGKLSINFKPDKEVNNKNLLIAIVASIGFITLCTFFFNSGINYVFSINKKIIWLIIFTFLTIPGFFVGHKETALLYQSKLSNKRNKLIFWLIVLVPFFFIVSIFFGILGSISGMIGSIHGIIILIFAIISGNFIAKLTKSQLWLLSINPFLFYSLF